MLQSWPDQTQDEVIAERKKKKYNVQILMVNTLDGGSARYGYDSICLVDSIWFHMLSSCQDWNQGKIIAERKKKKYDIERLMVNTLNPLPDMDMMALVGSIWFHMLPSQ